jgi:hypothetical protein
MPVAKISQHVVEALGSWTARAKVAQDVVEVLRAYEPPTPFVSGSVNIPVMTSDTAPSGVCSASSSYGATAPWRAFDYGNPADGWGGIGWITNGGGTPAWLQYQFDSPVTIAEYSFRAWWSDAYPGRTPKTWTFQGSSDGSTWVDLDSQTDWVVPNSGDYFAFPIASPASYAYYRLYVTANNGDWYVGVGGLRMYSYASPCYALVSQDVIEVLHSMVAAGKVSQDCIEVLMSGDGASPSGGSGGVKSFGFTT